MIPSGNQLYEMNEMIHEFNGKNSQLNLLLGTFNRVRAVADVAANSKGVVTADGA